MSAAIARDKAVEAFLRPLRPSDALALAVADAQERGKGTLAIWGWGLALAWWCVLGPLSPFDWAPLAMVLLVMLAVAGVQLVVTCHRKGRQGFWSRELAGVVTVGLVGIVSFCIEPGGYTRAACVLSIAGMQFLTWRPESRRVDPWWAHHFLALAFVNAGILKMGKTPRTGEPMLPTILYPGHLIENDYGTWRKIELPPGTTYEDVRKHHSALASSLTPAVPAKRLHIEQDPDAGANVVTLAVLHKRPSVVVPAAVPDEWDFFQPIPLGVDRLGRPVCAQTYDTHTLTVGKTRSGKTWLARLLVAYALMDVRVPLWMISGKDAAGDWRALADHKLCVMYATIRDLKGVEACLDSIDAEVQRREKLDRKSLPMGLVMADEWPTIIDNAKSEDPALAKRLDKKMSVLARVMAGYNIHLITTSHRGTGDYISTGLRANLGQRFVGVTKDPKKEVSYTMEMDNPPLAYPREQGEFLASWDDSEPNLVRVPMLDDEAFRALCEKAAKRRGTNDPRTLEGEAVVVNLHAEPPRLPDDPLVVACWDALRELHSGSATEVFDRLPAELQDVIGSNVRLGIRLKDMEGVEWSNTGPKGGRVYRLIPHPHGAPGTPRWLSATGTLAPRSEGPDDLVGAATGTSDEHHPHLRSLP